MRFLISVIDCDTDTATNPEYEAINRFNARLKGNDQFVLATGLARPESIQVIDARTTTAPTIEGVEELEDEFMSGLWIIDAEDNDAALKLAVEASIACNRKVQLRAFL